MTMLRNFLLLTVLIVAFGFAAGIVNAGDTKPVAVTSSDPGSPYLAQMPGGPGGMPGDPMHGPFGDPMRQRKHLEELRMLKMLELLNLSSEQEIPFLTTFNQMRIEQRNLDEKSDVLLDSMATELALTKPNEARLKDLITRVKTLEKQRFQQINTFIDRVDSLLTTEQEAKLLIFQKRFEMELLEQIGRFRRGPGGLDSSGIQEP
jgi:hypothetical protein